MVDGDLWNPQARLARHLLWRGKDNAELLIPNQQFFTDKATSYTATDRMRRSQTVGAAYHDPEKVIAIWNSRLWVLQAARLSRTQSTFSELRGVLH